MTAVRLALPRHLRTLARVPAEVELDVAAPPTITSVLDALEARYPALRGTIRDHGGEARRAYIRFFACGRDLSHDEPGALLPECVTSGDDVLCVVGAISGG